CSLSARLTITLVTMLDFLEQHRRARHRGWCGSPQTHAHGRDLSLGVGSPIGPDGSHTPIAAQRLIDWIRTRTLSGAPASSGSGTSATRYRRSPHSLGVPRGSQSRTPVRVAHPLCWEGTVVTTNAPAPAAGEDRFPGFGEDAPLDIPDLNHPETAKLIAQR